MSEKLYTIAVLKAKEDKFDEMFAVLEELASRTHLQHSFGINTTFF